MVMSVFSLPLEKISAGFVISDAIEYNIIFNMFHKIFILIYN